MVSRYAFVTGRGLMDLVKGTSTPAVPAGTKVIDENAENYVVIAPINRNDMWRFTGSYAKNASTGVESGYGSYSNFTNTAAVQVNDGPYGSPSIVVEQNFPSNNNSNYAMPNTGTGISLTSTPLKGGAVEEASIEFHFRAVSAGVPWGWGGKIPGLGGLKPGASGGVPTGGQPSPNGFSCRMMFRRIGTAADANMNANLVSYFYSPNLPAGAIGNDISTGKVLKANTWHKIKQYHKMNTVITEGDTNPPADGIHRIWLDDVLCYESTTTVYRFYTDAKITHLVWDNFYGGNDVTDGKPWGPVADTRHQFDNHVITTY